MIMKERKHVVINFLIITQGYMRLLYFCEEFNPFSPKKSGIEKKVYSQIMSLREEMDVKVEYSVVPKNTLDRICFILPFIWSKRESNWKAKLMDSSINYRDFEYMYIRKPSLSLKFYSILHYIKKQNPSIKIMMEIPTYPNTNEYHGIKKIMVLKSVNCERKLRKVVDYILTYSRDKTIWGISCLNIANCVDYSSIAPREHYCPIKNTLRMTFVADFMYWHGADRLIQGIAQYKGNYDVILNIVGNGAEIENLKRLANNDSRIIFHGFKTSEEMNEIFNNTDIAIDSLGRHRSGITYNSTLKGKEYSARGIPVVSAVQTEFDYMPGYKYYLKVPADESVIVVDDIVKFFEKVLLDNNYETITTEIRSITENVFDFSKGFKKPIMETIIRGDK